MTKAIYTYIPFDGEGDQEARELKAHSGQTVDVKAWNDRFSATFPDGYIDLVTEDELEFLPRRVREEHTVEPQFVSQYWADVFDDLKDPIFKSAFDLVSNQIAERDAKANSAEPVVVRVAYNTFYGRKTWADGTTDWIELGDSDKDWQREAPGGVVVIDCVGENLEAEQRGIDESEITAALASQGWPNELRDAKEEVEKLKHLNANQAKTIALHQSAYSKLSKEVEEYKEALSWESTHLAERTNQFDKAVEKIDKLNKKLIAITKVLDGESSV